MKKKGFTLVELLAVIAILAILVIIALPNVMSLFNEAKKNSFANELKEIYKTAQNQWMMDSMIDTKKMFYSRNTSLKCDGSNNNSTLKLSGRTQLDYGITIDKSGNVMQFVASDGTFMYQFSAATVADALKIENIGTANVAAANTGNAIVRLADYSYTGAQITCASDTFSITGTN